MKNLWIFTAMVLLMWSCKEQPKQTASNDDSASTNVAETPTQSEWKDLDFSAWQAFKGGAMPKYWTQEEGAIVFHPPTADERNDENGNRMSFNIVTKESFSSFVLSLEWKISEAGNSGIMWGVSEEEKYVEPYQTGLEVQVLDNDKHPDGKNGTSHQAGALYDLVSPVKDVTKPIGEWNVAVITVNHETNEGTSVLNGVEVAKFPVGGEALTELLKGSKFESWEGFATYKEGKIALQDHNDVVSYRNIKIKVL